MFDDGWRRMGGVLLQVDWAMTGMILTKSLTLTAAVVGGICVYLFGAYLFKVQEVKEGGMLMFRRKKRNDQ